MLLFKNKFKVELIIFYNINNNFIYIKYKLDLFNITKIFNSATIIFQYYIYIFYFLNNKKLYNY